MVTKPDKVLCLSLIFKIKNSNNFLFIFFSTSLRKFTSFLRASIIFLKLFLMSFFCFNCIVVFKFAVVETLVFFLVLCCSLCWWLFSYLSVYPCFSPIGVVEAMSLVTIHPGSNVFKAQMVTLWGRDGVTVSVVWCSWRLLDAPLRPFLLLEVAQSLSHIINFQ